MNEEKIIERINKLNGFRKIKDVIEERFVNLKEHTNDIINFYKGKNADILFINTNKSNWFNTNLIFDLLTLEKKEEQEFSKNYVNEQPSIINNIIPYKLLKSMESCNDKFSIISPVSLKIYVKLTFLNYF